MDGVDVASRGYCVTPGCGWPRRHWASAPWRVLYEINGKGSHCPKREDRLPLR